MKRFKILGWLSGGACALFLAYTLSAGPVCRLEPHLNPSLHAKLECFYSPLAWLCMHNVLFGNTMKWYLDRWTPPKSIK
jgi:hypothetical protein